MMVGPYLVYYKPRYSVTPTQDDFYTRRACVGMLGCQCRPARVRRARGFFRFFLPFRTVSTHILREKPNGRVDVISYVKHFQPLVLSAPRTWKLTTYSYSSKQPFPFVQQQRDLSSQ